MFSSLTLPTLRRLAEAPRGYADRVTWSPTALPAVPPALHRKHGIRGALFTVLVVAALFLGAAVIAFVFAASGRPDAIAVGLMLALLPVGPLVACYLWL